MKMKCVIASYLHGDIVKVGQVIDISASEAETSRIKRSFVAVGGTEQEEAKASPAPVSSEPAAQVVAGLNREQAIMKLRQAGVKFRGNISNENLSALWDQTFANIAEATEK